MKILFLYTLVTNSVYAVLRSLTEYKDVEILVIYWDKGGNKPVNVPHIPKVVFQPVSAMSSNDIFNLSKSFGPNLIYVTAWQERRYLYVVYKFRIMKIPVVAGFDDNWLGNFRQHLGSVIVMLFSKYFFSHAMVSGPRQYHYAIKFGFKDSQILYYLFSADVNSFLPIEHDNLMGKSNFIFVGRYHNVKGISTLADAFKIYKSRLNGKFNLICFGNGPQRSLLEGIEDVTVNDYADMTTIVNEASKAVAFILPSTYDPSPLIVHEMVSLGLPLVLSENVGNKHIFLINHFNGFTFKTSDPNDLARAMLKFDGLTLSELQELSKNSYRLSLQHRPDFVAASLISVVKR